MKIQELRERLQASERDNLEKAFAECYKQLRKGQKEEIDPVLVEILEGRATEKKKSEKTVDFEELKCQITEFTENAYAQNYFAPNRVVPKSQRPKWRFLVKNFIKELEKIPLESEDYVNSVKLLSDLYHLMCEGCNYCLFTSDDPFRSIGWEQPRLFELLVKRTFAAGYTRESISQMLVYATSGGLSRESLHIKQELVLLYGLKTSDVKDIAIEEAKKIVEENENKLAGMGKYDNKRYYLGESVNQCCAMIFLLLIQLAEPGEAMKYYFKHAKYATKETVLYCALDLVNWVDADDLWIEVYEYGIRKRIRPRESLAAEYEKRKSEVKEERT